MKLVLVYMFVSVLFELAAPWIPSKNLLLRTFVAAASVGLLVAACIYLLIHTPSWFTIGITVLAIYRVINLLRIIKGRMHPAYLWRTCLETTSWLALFQLGLWIVGLIWHRADVQPVTVWTVLAVLQILIATILLRTINGHVKRSIEPTNKPGVRPAGLPSITVAIAARNETGNLIQCLESIVASNYQKLEILVLDDCSQTRRTPEIIRSFAHDGVRFVPGAEPNTDWLARNQAYDTLAQVANGDYILYCSTAVRLEPDSLRKLVGYAVEHDKTMVSALPRLTGGAADIPLVEPIRAAWELLLPRRRLGRPPVASSSWLVKKSALQKAGGFAAVSRMVTPEAYFAKRFTEHDGYSFLAAGGYFGFSSSKSASEDYESAIRTLYPALHRRPEVVAGAALLLTVFGIVPFAGVFAVAVSPRYFLLSIISICAVTIMVLAYRQLFLLRYQKAPLLALLGLPLAVLAMIYLQHLSMYKYEFQIVLWKERNICVPVMHTVAHLPSA